MMISVDRRIAKNAAARRSRELADRGQNEYLKDVVRRVPFMNNPVYRFVRRLFRRKEWYDTNDVVRFDMWRNPEHQMGRDYYQSALRNCRDTMFMAQASCGPLSLPLDVVRDLDIQDCDDPNGLAAHQRCYL